MALKSHPFVYLIRSLRPLLWPCVMLLLAATLGACGSNRMLPEPLPLAEVDRISSASDEYVSVSLDTLLVRDGLHMTHVLEDK